MSDKQTLTGWIENTLTERELGLPSNALVEGRISWVKSDSSSVCWCANGGIVCTQDEELADRIATLIDEGERDDYVRIFPKLQSAIARLLPDAKCNMCALFYCASPIDTEWAGRVDIELLLPSEARANPRPGEIFLGIREDSLITSYACALPRYEAGSHQFYWIGVHTHEDFRRRGLGKACVLAMLEYMGPGRSIAIWQCRTTNAASMAMARSLGFLLHSWSFDWHRESESS